MGMLTLLAACNGPNLDDPSILDQDHDGVAAPADCDDTDASVFPGAVDVPGDSIDQDCDGSDSLPERIWHGSSADEGFGTSVLVARAGVVVGAPFSGDPAAAPDGRVYGPADGSSIGPAVSLQGADGDRAGAALASLADGTLLVGAPGNGGVRTIDGKSLLTLDGAGGVLAARGASWVTSTATGALRNDGVRLDWDRRPDALALDVDGQIWAGFARGPAAVRFGDISVARLSPTDEAGFSLLLADVGRDGKDDLVVGAPGAGVVYVLDPAALPASLADATPVGPGTGRFGASLAVDGEGVLYVGAPMAGATVAGAVYTVLGPVAHARWTGEEPGEQLGFSIATGGSALVIGAPGAASSPGSVRIVVP